MDEFEDLQQPDEPRPAKRVKLDAPLALTEEVQDEMVDEDDWDDIYEESAPPEIHAGPGEESALQRQLHVEGSAPGPGPPEQQGEEMSAVPVEAIHNEEEIAAPEQVVVGADEASARMLQETSQVEGGLRPEDRVSAREMDAIPAVEKDGVANGSVAEVESDQSAYTEQTELPVVKATNGDKTETAPAPKHDAGFLAAAAAQKDNHDAEWQFEPSDALSSDSDSDTSSDDSPDDSDSDSEGGYEMLDPATAAKILMSGDGEDDGGEKSKGKGGDRQPRTANEVKEEAIPKPDVVVTEDMTVTYLGDVERTIDNMVMIKGATPGEYQVLEVGSVLCNEKREVIGAVADTFGRVQEPFYSVAFTNAAEIEEAGLEFGVKVFYVDSHSTFVFTQPLKNLKGTDASNIHDEEVGEDELEFSDDEEEQEYKRQRKAAKRGGRGTLSRSAFNQDRATRSFGAPGHDSGKTYVSTNDAPQHQYGGGLSYDDGDGPDEFYVPLKRPDNLSQLMAGGGLPPPRPQQGGFERGRKRGRGFDRGRGRGDRGRGRGRFDQRGGRGGHNDDRNNRGGRGGQNGFRGNAHSFPDRHNNDLAPSPPSYQSRPQNQHAPQSSPPSQQRYQQYQPQAQSSQTYQFNGYTFQHGNPPPAAPTPQAAYYNQPAQAHSPSTSIPAGAYVNPAFFQTHQRPGQWMQQPQQQPQQPAYGGGQGQQYQQQYAQPGAMQSPTQQNNLADILKRMSGQQ